VNGSRIVGTDLDAGEPFRIGLLATGADFEIDDLRVGALRVGDMRVAPARLGLAQLGNHLDLQLGDGAQRYPVRTVTDTRVTAPGIAATSSAPEVASVAVDGDTLVVTPRGTGSAIVTVSDANDNNLAAAVEVTVSPAFAAPASSPIASLRERAAPSAHARDVPVDTLLRLRFDAPPALGTAGSVRIHRARDGKLVDLIRIGDEVDTIGAARDGVRRVVRYQPFEVDGNTLTIHPHDGRLAYGTDYVVLVDANLAPGATLDGKPFAGIGKGAGWTFRTRERMPAGTTLTVDDDGPADFRTIQGALDHAMRHLPRSQPVKIRVANGRYPGLLYLRGKDKVTLQGASRDGVVVTARNNDSMNPGAGKGQPMGAPGAVGGRAVFLVEDADLLHLDSLTLLNDAWNANPPAGQSETINFASDGRLIATNASFFSEQDTIRVEGYSWFYRSLIAGNVDFIWGPNHAALFEEDEIRSVAHGNPKARGGYVVQARTLERDDSGFVFLNSRLTYGPGPLGAEPTPGAYYLARPGPLTSWDYVSYINCQIDAGIHPSGWSGKPRDGVGWYEYGSMDPDGKPLNLSSRTGGAVLDAAGAERFSSRARVFARFGQGRGWDPQPGDGL
jgi:pectin methylesterase-like acyl-CoA thioesterase